MSQALSAWCLRRSRAVLRGGGVIAYPTEAVWGLGCLPGELDAVLRLLQIKRRPAHKGLILIAACWEQLRPWVADENAPPQAAEHWPGHVTCLVPAAPGLSPLIRGQHSKVAVRISAHPGVRALCNAVDSALISTSANLSGRPATRSSLMVRRQLGRELDAIVPGRCGQGQRASRIIDPESGHLVRS